MGRFGVIGAAAFVWVGITGTIIGGSTARAGGRDHNTLTFENRAGQMETFSTAREIDPDNPFFQDLGSNGRRCVSCHQPDSAWSITPANLQTRFNETHGRDPVFHNNDGSNCENAAPATLEGKRRAYSLLLSRGLLRIGLDLPTNAEFIIDGVRDPNHCGPASNQFSLYRRPLPAANLAFLSAVMWDGRESGSTTTLLQDLRHQALDATLGHAQAAVPPTDAEVQAIVNFELSLVAAQSRDKIAGALNSSGASGGPGALVRQPFFIGINDPVGLNPSGAPFSTHVFSIYDAWSHLTQHGNDRVVDLRRSIARGQEIFNSRPITISGVSGLNGNTFASGVSVPDRFVGACSTCHDAPNAGGHSVKAPLDIGVADPATAPYLPVYTLRSIATGETVETTDPGRALISGKWSDIGRFKGPILRALAARAPYFHNGSAETLEEVLDFYERRFQLNLTAHERADLLAFLRSL